MTLRLRAWLLSLLVALPSALAGQSIGANVGPAVPLGSLAEYRHVGFRAQGSLSAASGLLRAEVAGVYIPGTDDPDASDWRTRDWRSVSIGGSVLPMLGRSEALRLRGLFGLSAHRSRIRGVSNPYGTVPGLQLGAVLERSWRTSLLTAELGLHVVASDYGVDESGGAFFVPLLVGFRW
ncbi:MAG TPA: hypothetical protein VHG51_02345 [Longimicrobiaceae bacterium]|nr:hypothetical protein [Longimicrobiaceae bacterium]